MAAAVAATRGPEADSGTEGGRRGRGSLLAACVLPWAAGCWGLLGVWVRGFVGRRAGGAPRGDGMRLSVRGGGGVAVCSLLGLGVTAEPKGSLEQELLPELLPED